MRKFFCLSWACLPVLLLSLAACQSPPTDSSSGASVGAALGAILGQDWGGKADLSGAVVGGLIGSDASAPSRSKDGLTLVCVAVPGNCYVQRPIKAGAQCECAGSEGIAAGRGLNVRAGQTVSLSSVVRVYFATDRERLAASGAVQDFGTGRSDAFSYGVVDVSIPATHQTGFIETPSVLVRIRFLENPAKHVLLLRSALLGKNDFAQQLRLQIRAAQRREAFLFVHGFNVTFEEAALRTAQIAYDLGFRGAPIFYSWPSKGSPTPLAYMADSQTIEWAKGNFKVFLEDFLRTTNAERVYLIAHSMGTRALTDTVASLLVAKPELREKVKEIILAAPDIDAGIYRRDIAPAMVRAGRPVTVYASSVDKALQLSHRANDYPRAGDAGDGLVLVDGIETIDASSVSMGFLGHSVFAESREVFLDWQYIIDQSLRAGDRAGLRQVDMQKPYWVFRK